MGYFNNQEKEMKFSTTDIAWYLFMNNLLPVFPKVKTTKMGESDERKRRAMYDIATIYSYNL